MSFSILGTGKCVPELVVTNEMLESLVETTDEWIKQRVGVEERHICVNETVVDLACQAALNALEASHVDPSELDLILCATVSGENVSPSLACSVQSRLGASCIAFDINAACSAFIFLLETAAGFFARGTVKKALIIGAEQLSRVVDWSDRCTCVIFGDGAGAVVLGEGDGFRESTLSCKGGDNVLKIPNFAGKSPFFKKESEEPYIQMKGQETFKFAVNAIQTDINFLLAKSGLSAYDIKYIVPHQANRRIIDCAASKLGLPVEKFYVNIERYGNTSSASIGIALDEMARGGLIEKGDKLILTAFGSGLSNASCIIEW